MPSGPDLNRIQRIEYTNRPYNRSVPRRDGPTKIGIMPPRKGQMATPATRRDSQELAKEAADRDMYGMDVDYESPTPRPQPNEDMLQIIQQMQQ